MKTAVSEFASPEDSMAAFISSWTTFGPIIRGDVTSLRGLESPPWGLERIQVGRKSHLQYKEAKTVGTISIKAPDLAYH
ncbi:MAG: hypothetical protein LUQ50_00725 [Methanospirillum sp.]|uniref:hypothetical protein n=1 Tax=Methanospirillum sp. TaxID=45200 RepID=UPI00237065BB|nr:hypothetical protein [Methanospirillum sp.]MDD1727576.1 hypothetical protein [Methanospirillum sp.]